ncbi:MAG: LacI family DNA-binding transcriptional regulator [Sneathiella sp.]
MQKVWARQSDIAKEADVSLATVDRCLNKRAGVSIHTSKRVWDAVEKLQSGGAEDPSISSDSITLDVILPGGTNSFLNMLAEEVALAGENYRKDGITVRCHRIEGFSPQILADCISDVSKSSNGIAVMALENPLVREAVNNACNSGLPVVTLVSNLSAQTILGYVGLNNRAAGRTAAYLVNLFSRTHTGKVALFEGSLHLAYSDHQEREFGFIDALREYAPEMSIVGKWATQDNHEEAYQKTIVLLQGTPDLSAIYCIGGGIRGICRALKEKGRDKDIICIGHDLTHHTREFLLDGTLNAIINQDTKAEANAALKLLVDYHRKNEVKATQVHIKSEIYFRENLP